MILLGSTEEITALGADAFPFQGGSDPSELGLRQAVERLLVLSLEGAWSRRASLPAAARAALR